MLNAGEEDGQFGTDARAVAINCETELPFVTGEKSWITFSADIKAPARAAMGSVREITLGFQLTHSFETRRRGCFLGCRQTLI